MSDLCEFKVSMPTGLPVKMVNKFTSTPFLPVPFRFFFLKKIPVAYNRALCDCVSPF
jgi:hypothetical protein